MVCAHFQLRYNGVEVIKRLKLQLTGVYLKSGTKLFADTRPNNIILSSNFLHNAILK